MRQVFYSFHYEPDSWRVSQVRNIGVVEGNRPVNDNEWEEVKGRGNNAIERWINDQLAGKSCTVVLVGSNTANRKWINYEIIKSWGDRKGVVGIHISGLEDNMKNLSQMGKNPFDYIRYGNSGKQLSAIVRCYNPTGSNSQERYGWIKNHLANAVEEAIAIRMRNP